MSHIKIRAIVLVATLGLSTLLQAKTTAPAPLAPGPNDGSIAYITARLFGTYHYSQNPFDTGISEKFFNVYLDTYDPQHLYFLQSDIDEFSQYRTNLATLTLGTHGESDVTPAYKVFNRFMERLQQRVAYADDLLKRDKFKFDTDERVELNRKDAPYPKTLDDAKRIWREQLYFDYLREKLDHEDSPGQMLSTTNRADIIQMLTHRYDRDLRFFQEWDSGDVLQTYLDSLAHAYDPHSDYMNNEHAQDFAITMSLGLFGIGAELTSDDGYCKINSLVPGGPAAKSNQIKPGDKIIAVAQGKNPPEDVIDMELGKIVQKIRGQKGTEVRLTIIPADDPKSHRVVTLIRDQINLQDEQARAQLIETPAANGGTNRIGVVTVPSFYAPVDATGRAPELTNFVSAHVAKLLQKLKDEKVNGVILDLRNNPGGSLEEAVQFVGLFVTNGPVVQIRSPDESSANTESIDKGPDLYHGPLIVLVNRFSASASEIVAAALQDYGRALVVGDTSTFGKGSVQNLDPLRNLVWPTEDSDTNDPGMLKITIRKFYRINGASTQLKGVIPDIVLPDVLSYSDEIGESALPYAMPWDTIPSADYTKFNYVRPYLDTLQRKAYARVATNLDFAYVKQDIAELEKLQDEKSDTLNERMAWDEKEKLDTQKKAREKEISSRKIPNETIYDITVADAGKPGLPPPVQLETEKEATNSVAEAASTNAVNAPEKKVWGPDPMLDETRRIMQDYISLEPSRWNILASHE